MTDIRRLIPRTDAVLADPDFTAPLTKLGRARVKAAVNEAQRLAREGVIAPGDVPATALAALSWAGPRRVVNATGVLLHTNLGRAPLPAAAVEALAVAAGATDVELDLATGRRGRRGRTALAALAAAVPAAGGVHLVNNNAAALVLAATAFAGGREIVISRGEMVEIGDGFRLPDLLVSTGARLREVGTTNRTSVDDYAAAIGPDTGFVLKVHPSNYRIEGFTGTPGIAELAGVCREAGLPLVADAGSGLLRPEPLLPGEPDAATWLKEGADLVTASGDKLLGGPQCGLILGRADLVERLRRHPLARALRVDKLTLAALEATLAALAASTATSATGGHPVTDALHADPVRLRRRARALAARLTDAGIPAHAVDSEATAGGGSAPGVTLASAAVALDAALAGPLREGDPAVLGRVEHGRCLLDLRTVAEPGDDELFAAVVAACG
ncbi:L-seryl-tRNA(Sec) selenium transferase [Planobispora takensis]|uniref:L-seryl-tRNA(Sec) selenium transferase n=1 Tax=Planobispora takensis TaxID=1367882 RepID=A0A8J3ST24_9ACTN|nr:L-seryl-tRNA(Sec) selenium transferase [Planobispora takensis]GIH98406.1 L-seryl-tRNA(Sec) selenium transferase [Planobispora takensis]